MSRFFKTMAQLSIMLFTMSPLFLIFGVNATDTAAFVHNWFIFILAMIVICLVSTVLMSVCDS